jgi:LysM repeat protein
MTYTVQRGDSLSKIAQRLGIPWQTLYNWNKSVVGNNPNLIYAGQVLRTQDPAIQQQAAPAPVAPAPVVNQAQTGAQQAAEEVPKIPFEQILNFEQFFPEQLARSSIAQRSARYYDPLVAQAQEGIMGDFANRGLSRSGQRSKTVMDTYKDFADKEATMREQLYGTVYGQAKEDHRYQEGLYEKNPTGYQKQTFDKSNYTYQFPEESPQKYSQSYRDWMRNAYKI